MPKQSHACENGKFSIRESRFFTAFYLCAKSTGNRIESNQLARELRVFFETDCLPSKINRLPGKPRTDPWENKAVE